MNRQQLWAPWRIGYLKDQTRKTGESGCFLCEAIERPDEDDSRLVLHRDEAGMILMNRYPYTNGHLMVAPRSHVGRLRHFTAEQRAGLMELTTLAERLIQAVLDPQGLNIGINVGRPAGAGLPGHLHVHLVPRWGGDTNFMDVVGNIRVIPQALEETYRELAAALPDVLAEAPSDSS